MSDRDKVYFVSDSHLGIPDHKSSLQREKLLVDWLQRTRRDARSIYFLGDIFDFWFEYRHVVPRGFVRLLGKMAELADEGIDLHYFTGNHDMWAFDYFQQELGVTMHRKPMDLMVGDKVFHIGHGDGLGPGDRGYKLLKAVFSCALCQRAFAFIHPGIGMRLALYFSRKSRLANAGQDREFLGKEKEWLVLYCQEILKERHVDYFIFGHRHLPMRIEVAPGVLYYNTGDWFYHYSYAVYDGRQLELCNHPAAK